MADNITNNQHDKHHVEGTQKDLLQRNALYKNNHISDASKISRYVVLDVIPDPSVVDDDKIKYYRELYKSHNLGSSVINVLNAEIPQYKRLARNTVIARQIYHTGADNEAKFLFPFFPQHLSMPCNPGEHVWCFEESSHSQNNDTLYWICRIPAPYYVEDLNHTHDPRIFERTFHDKQNNPKYSYDNVFSTSSGPIGKGISKELYAIFGEKGENDEYVKIIKKSESKEAIVNEAVPRHKKRPGDFVIQGSNNTLISLETDRENVAFDFDDKEVTIDSKTEKVKKISDSSQENQKVKIKVIKKPDNLGKESGAIDIVAGQINKGNVVKTSSDLSKDSLEREESGKTTSPNKNEKEKVEGEPDYELDKSRIYLSQKTNVDKKLNIENKLKENHDKVKVKINSTSTGDAAIFEKSDKIRLVGRKDVSIVVTNDDKDVSAVITISNSGDILIQNTKRVIIKSENVMIGDESTQHPIPLGDKLKDWLSNHTHIATGGTTDKPVLSDLEKLETILSKNCYVKE